MHRVFFETMGCRLNQAETAVLQDRFLEKGYTLSDDPADADLFVLHTCTLTAQATQQCRRRLRQVMRKNPAACVAAIGCHAQTDAAELAQLEGVDYIVGTADKMRLADIIPTPARQAQPVVITGRMTPDAFTMEGAGRYPHHTRASLKIQEGCDFVCAFCIIPRSRGRARSRSFDDVVREARRLATCGHREIVLTGVNIGTYLAGKRTLADVSDALDDIDGIDRIRISSIEPTTIDTGVLDRMARGSKLCPYLHVPLQSGDDRVLEAMRRRYDAGSYRRFLKEAMDRVPGITFGTDVVVGFPGEDEAAFERSCEMIREFPFVNVHVFSFSARPRTSAFGMTDTVPAREIRRRHDLLQRVSQLKVDAVYESMVGRELRVLCERPAPDGTPGGFSDEYIRVRIRGGDSVANQMVRVQIREIEMRLGERVAASGYIVGKRGRWRGEHEESMCMDRS
jgi:threonylcarbamoyladenosine tRNA methylthiotransferase MtaB